MNVLQTNLSRIVTFLLSMFIIFAFCKQEKEPAISSQPAPRDSSRTNVQQLMLNNQSETDIEQNINALLNLIREKEAELKQARLEMKQKSMELAQKEQQLAKVEHQIKQFRRVSYFILAVGLVLIGIGLLLILKRKKAHQK